MLQLLYVYRVAVVGDRHAGIAVTDRSLPHWQLGPKSIFFPWVGWGRCNGSSTTLASTASASPTSTYTANTTCTAQNTGFQHARLAHGAPACSSSSNDLWLFYSWQHRHYSA